MTMLSAPISTRNQFGSLLNNMGLTGLAVEVGTHRGEFAAAFLSGWEGERLYCVDPWSNPPDYIEQAKYLCGDGNRQEDKVETIRSLMKYSNRVQIFQALSMEALKHFNDESLDFVYLDGNHEPPHVENDIWGWWAKLKSGGVLAGHDFLCPGEPDGQWGRYIQPAILEFCDTRSLNIQLIVEEGGLPWSYFIVKESK